MHDSGAFPTSVFQAFANTIANAEVGEFLTDPRGCTVRRVSYNSVEVGPVGTVASMTLDVYLKGLQLDLDGYKGDDLSGQV